MMTHQEFIAWLYHRPVFSRERAVELFGADLPLESDQQWQNDIVEQVARDRRHGFVPER